MEINTKENLKMTRNAVLVMFQLILGTYYYTNGNKYQGEWKNDKVNGKGN